MRGACVLLVMIVIMAFFYLVGSAGIYWMLTYKYLTYSPGVSCQNVLDNYYDHLPTLANQELGIIFNAYDHYGNSTNSTDRGIPGID